MVSMELTENEAAPAVETQAVNHDQEAQDGLTPEELEAEKRLLWKLDKHIIPLVMLLYLFSFLDR